jgi:drug/metabolite transporter (DMT)-like permease
MSVPHHSPHPASPETSEKSSDSEQAVPQFRPRIRAIWSLLAVVGCVTAAEVFLKMGSETKGVATLLAPYTIIGIVFHLAGFAAWAYTLRSVPLSLAINFVTVQQVMVPLGAWIFLHENISWTRWTGIGVLLAGVL